MDRFDANGAHSLVCIQTNTGVPDEHRECVCSAVVHAAGHHAAVMQQPLRRDFEPDFGIDGPFTASRPRRLRAWLRGFAVTLACVWALSFLIGAARHFNWI